MYALVRLAVAGDASRRLWYARCARWAHVRCACGVHVLLLMLCVCVCMSGGTICFIGTECVRVCGPVRVNGILTEDPPSHVSGRVLVWTRNERVSTRPSVWAKHILYMRTHATLTLSHEPCNSYQRPGNTTSSLGAARRLESCAERSASRHHPRITAEISIV